MTSYGEYLFNKTALYANCRVQAGGCLKCEGKAQPCKSNVCPQAFPRMGNMLMVDAVNGNDSNATTLGCPYKTVNAAVSHLNPGGTLWILPGTYDLSTGIVLPSSVCVQGESPQNTTIQMLSCANNTTLVTLDQFSVLQNLSLRIQSASNVDLTAVRAVNRAPYSSRIENCTIYANANLIAVNDYNIVCGIEMDTTEVTSPSSLTHFFTQNVNIQVFGNGDGFKYGVLIPNGTTTTFANTTIYTAPPIDSNSAGSYFGLMTDNIIARAYLYDCILQGPARSNTGNFTAADLCVSSGWATLNSGTNLVNRNAAEKEVRFDTQISFLQMGVKGLLRDATTTTSYLAPGTQIVQGGGTAYPYADPFNIRITRPTLLTGLYCSLEVLPVHSTVVTVYKNNTFTFFSSVLNDTDTEQNTTDRSLFFDTGDKLSVRLDVYGGSSNTASNLSVQLNLY